MSTISKISYNLVWCILCALVGMDMGLRIQYYCNTLSWGVVLCGACVPVCVFVCHTYIVLADKFMHNGLFQHNAIRIHFALKHFTEISAEISVTLMHSSLFQYNVLQTFYRWKEEMSTISTNSYNMVRCGVMRFGGDGHGAAYSILL